MEFLKKIFRKKVRKVAESAELSWITVAKGELGVHEIRGRKHNDRILEYHSKTSYHAEKDEISWCASFVNWVFSECGIKGTNSASARSWIRWGKKLDKPIYGCVVIFWRGKKDGWKGHVGFYLGHNRNGDLIVLGGNQNDQVSIKAYSEERVLCYVWPS